MGFFEAKTCLFQLVSQDFDFFLIFVLFLRVLQETKMHSSYGSSAKIIIIKIININMNNVIFNINIALGSLPTNSTI